jgi:hypothetical protein
MDTGYSAQSNGNVDDAIEYYNQALAACGFSDLADVGRWATAHAAKSDFEIQKRCDLSLEQLVGLLLN